MVKTAFRVTSHYSGLLMAHCPEEPDLVVLASDHDELASLMQRALSERSAMTVRPGADPDT